MEPVREISTDTLFANTFIKGWAIQLARVDEFLEATPDEDLLREIAPGKNTGIYLLGHLTAVHDAMLPLLGFGEKMYPHLEGIFVTSPDKSGKTFPSVAQLRQDWRTVNGELMKHYTLLKPAEWLTRHEAVSSENFAREPHRNKLSVLISRTAHMAYHFGQLIFLKKK